MTIADNVLKKTVAEVRALFLRRKNSENILDALPNGRVTWTEVLGLLRKNGYSGDPVTARLEWHEATKFLRWPK